MTAGEILSMMIKKETEGEDIAELKEEFREQSVKQLGGYCSEFRFDDED